jgi:hypothetical protein
MNNVMVERRLELPLTDADIRSLFDASGGCLARHRCDWCGSLLSADGRDLFCHFRAPDAESVRIALQQSGTPRGSVWSGTIHDAPGMPEAALLQANVMVTRRFAAATRLADIQAIEDAGSGCLDNHRVRFVRTYFSSDRMRMICLYCAPDAESVRIAQREAKMPVERVWSFRQLRPE